MKVHVTPQPGLSRAMNRVTHALMQHAPQEVEIVARRNDADLAVLHVIGFPETEETVRELVSRGQKFALIMYCLRSTQKPDTRDWLQLWQMSEVVWSYYDLQYELCHDHDVSVYDWIVPFYYAPLGVDEAFCKRSLHPFAMRDISVMTSGYVSHPCAEAIEEVAVAAGSLGRDVVHLGPTPVGLSQPLNGHWRTVHGISDRELASFYQRSRWVSGLRHIEGFELPALEGLCCGARPILFDRREMRHWYGDHAVYVPECHGEELIERLKAVFVGHAEPVTSAECQIVREQFQWEPIIHGFWEQVYSQHHEGQVV